MSEKPQKRLVGWKQYLGTIGSKWVRYFLVALCGCSGLGLLRQSVFSLRQDILHGDVKAVGISMLLLCGIVYAVTCAKTLFKETRQIEPVALLTTHNAHLLPPEESLMRASEEPAQQPSELLRAASQGPETPPEQLLRAGEEIRKEVP